MSSPSSLLKADSQTGVSLAQGTLQAVDTVAAGGSPRFIQLPSPVYVASWISTTHVLIAAGGGGSRFGMANVLVLLSIHLSKHNDVGLEIGNNTTCLGLSVKLNAEQHKMVATAAPPSSGTAAKSIGSDVHVPVLWRFVAALDLGGDVPWCASKYLPLERAKTECGVADDTTPISTQEWTLEASKCLQCAHGIIALSGIRTFSLIAVEYVSQNGQTGESIQASESSCRTKYRLTLLARIALPSEVDNEDKKPIAMVRDTVVVAQDECGIHAYDLRSLLPEGEGGGTVVQATPMAKWTLPGRVSDLHADRFNWVSVKPSPSQPTQESLTPSVSSRLSYRALVLDYVLVAALVRDKTLRLGSFCKSRRLTTLHRLHYGQEQPDEIKWEYEGEEQSESELTAINTIREEAVLTGKDCGLQFDMFPSSMRFVRLFGLETLSSSAQKTALKTLALRITEGDVGGSLMPLPLVSLVMVAYNQYGNQSFFLDAHVMVSGCSGAPFLEKDMPLKSNDMLVGSDCSSKRGDHLVHCRICMGTGGPSPIIKDAITCFSPCFGMDRCLEFPEKQTHLDFQRAMGASFPTHWLAGTVEGWIVLVVRNPQFQPVEFIVDSSCAGQFGTLGKKEGSRSKGTASERGDTSQPSFVLQHARPSFLLGRGGRPVRMYGNRRNGLCWGNPNTPLHSEPVTALAVSSLNDILSTDIAQNVVLSTLPMPIRSNSITKLPNHLSSMDFLPKVEGLELFPRELSFYVKFVGALATTHSLFIRIRWILLLLVVFWGVFLLFL